MVASDDGLAARLAKLGLRCESDPPLDRLTSATAALACFPMYMVANVHAWTGDRQFRVPILDMPGSESIREAFTIGKQEAQLDLDPEHRRVLGTLMTASKPADRVIYEYALETLRRFLDVATPELALTTRAAVAQMIVAVARASGKGPLGSGPKVSDEERDCIAQISEALGLESSEVPADILRTLEDY